MFTVLQIDFDKYGTHCISTPLIIYIDKEDKTHCGDTDNMIY